MAEELRADRWEGADADTWRARWRIPALELYRRIGSTNDRARRLAEAGAATGTVVLAEEQSAGRGRAGRSWHAPAGQALLCSIVLRTSGTSAGDVAAGPIPLLAGLAVTRTLERVAGVRAGIKWPNDVVIDGRKVAGILCEGALGEPGSGFVIAGIGLNVGQRAEDFPLEVRPHATSLYLATGRMIPRGVLAGAVIGEVLTLAAQPGVQLSAAQLVELRAHDVLAGHDVVIDGVARGMAQGIAADGALLVHGAAGTEHVRSGTVRLAGDADAAGRRP